MDDIRVSSVSDLLLIFDSKDTSSIINGVHPILEDPDHPLLARYISSQPNLPHILNLFPTIMQSSQPNYMSIVLSLLATSLNILVSKFNKTRPAVEISNSIINEQMKSLYRCLSSGNAKCLVSALDLLFVLSSLACNNLIRSMDFSHKGLRDASKIRKVDAASKISPRQAYIGFFTSLLDKSDYEGRLILSTNPFLLQYILDGIAHDTFDDVKELLRSIKDKIVFNEENNRNMATSFLKGRRLNSIATLLDGNEEKIRLEAKAFLISCFYDSTHGLCYPITTSITTLRNKLLYDLVMDLRPLDDEMHRDIILATVRNCPDVAWSYLSSTNLSFDPQPTVIYALAVNFAIKLITSLPSCNEFGSFMPKSITRSLLTRGISHMDKSVRLSTLLLLLASLRRLSSEPDENLKRLTKSVIPDFKTIYNLWKQNVGTEEETLFLEHCYLEVVYFYIKLNLDDAGVDMIKTTDIWKVGYTLEIIRAATQLCQVLDPLLLLNNQNDIDVLNTLLSSGELDESSLVIRRWLGLSNLVDDPLLCQHLSRRVELYSCILQAIYDVYHKPLIFPVDQDAILSCWGLTREAILKNQVLPVSMEIEEVSDLAGHKGNDEKNEVVRELDLDMVKSRIVANNAVDMVISAAAYVKRGRVGFSYVDILPNSNYVPPETFDDLLVSLFHVYDCPTWLHLMAQAFVESNAERIDLRGLVESNLLGYAIIGCSLENLELRKVSHLILSKYSSMVAISRVKERRQVLMVLTALANHTSPENPLAPLPRTTACLYAHALPLMLRPDHALYRTMNELFLAAPIVTPKDAFTKLFFDANGEWPREIHWILAWLESAMGRQGQHINEHELDRLHIAENLATLLLSTGIETASKELAAKILKNYVPDKNWIKTTLEFIESRNKV